MGDKAGKKPNTSNKPQSQGGKPQPQQNGGKFAGDKNRKPPRNELKLDESALKDIPKVPQPNREEFQKTIKNIDDTIAKIQSDLREIQKQIETKSDERKSLQEQQRRLVDELKALKAEVDAARTEKNKLLGEKEGVSTHRKSKEEELKKLRERVPAQFRGAEGQREFNLKAAIDKIELKIRELENMHKVTTMTLQEEKALLAEISGLHTAKRVAKEYDQERQKLQEAVDAAKPETGKINVQIDQQKKRLDQAQDIRSKKQQDLDVVKDGITKVGDAINALFTKREQLRASREEQYAIKGNLLKTKNEQEAAYSEYLKKVNEVRKEEYKKQAVLREAERKLKAKERLLEQLKEVPFEEELELCDLLIKNMQQYLIKEEPVATEVAPTSSAPAVDNKEFTVHKKTDDDDAEGPYGGKNKRNKNKQPRKPKPPALKPDSILRHNITTLGQFEKLSISCPLKVADVPKTLEEIEQKKEHYRKLGVERKKFLEEKVARELEEEAKRQAAEEAAAAANAAAADAPAAGPSGDATGDNAAATDEPTGEAVEVHS